MICRECAQCDHDRCYDVQHKTDYRSCTCLHRGVQKTDEATLAESNEE